MDRVRIVDTPYAGNETGGSAARPQSERLKMSKVIETKNGKAGRPPAMRRPRLPLRPGFSGLEMTNTELGDLVERALVRKLGWTPLVGAAAGKVRQGPFDMVDERGMYVEVKACSVYAGEYKVKPSVVAIEAKLAAAASMGVEAGTVMVIVDRSLKSGKLRGFVYRRPGLGCFRLGMSGVNWEFVGKVKVAS